MSNIKETIEKRSKNYGDFRSVAEASQMIKAILFAGNTYLEFHQKEAIEMICVKLARISRGNNPSYEENWRDIVGYAMLGGKLDEK